MILFFTFTATPAAQNPTISIIRPRGSKHGTSPASDTSNARHRFMTVNFPLHPLYVCRTVRAAYLLLIQQAGLVLFMGADLTIFRLDDLVSAPILKSTRYLRLRSLPTERLPTDRPPPRHLAIDQRQLPMLKCCPT